MPPNAARPLRRHAIALGTVVSLVGCRPSAPVVVRDAWLAPADSGPAAVYMRLANPGGDSAVVVQALTAVSRATELHETAQMRHDGMLMEHMTPVSRFVVMPHDSLTLDRVGRHVMLLGVARSVRVGDRLDVSLVSAHGWGAGAARDTVKFVAAVR